MSDLLKRLTQAQQRGSVAGSVAGESPAPSVVSRPAAAGTQLSAVAGGAVSSRRSGAVASTREVADLKLEKQKLREEIVKLKKEVETERRGRTDSEAKCFELQQQMNAIAAELGEGGAQMNKFVERLLFDLANRKKEVEELRNEVQTARHAAVANACLSPPSNMNKKAPAAVVAQQHQQQRVAVAAAPSPSSQPAPSSSMDPQVFAMLQAMQQQISTLATQMGGGGAAAPPAVPQQQQTFAAAPEMVAATPVAGRGKGRGRGRGGRGAATTATMPTAPQPTAQMENTQQTVAAPPQQQQATATATSPANPKRARDEPPALEQTQGRKETRGRKKADEVARLAKEAMSKGLVGVKAANVEGVKGPMASTKPAGLTVDFGEVDPIGRFMELREALAPHDTKKIALLRDQLVLFAQGKQRLARETIKYLFSAKCKVNDSSSAASDFAKIRRRMEFLADADFFDAFAAGCTEKVQQLMAVDALVVDHSEALRVLSFALRTAAFAAAPPSAASLSNSNGKAVGQPTQAPNVFMYDALVACLRAVRVLSNDTPENKTKQEVALHQLVAILDGATSSDAVPTARRAVANAQRHAESGTFVALTMRAISGRLIATSTNSNSKIVEHWNQYCSNVEAPNDVEGLPLEALLSTTLSTVCGSQSGKQPAAAADTDASVSSSAYKKRIDAVFAIRLQLLWKGFEYLDTIIHSIGNSGNENSSSNSNNDVYFAMILSFAIVDFSIHSSEGQSGSQDWSQFQGFFSAFATNYFSNVAQLHVCGAVLEAATPEGDGNNVGIDVVIRWVLQQKAIQEKMETLSRKSGGSSSKGGASSNNNAKKVESLAQYFCSELTSTVAGKRLGDSVSTLFAVNEE